MVIKVKLKSPMNIAKNADKMSPPDREIEVLGEVYKKVPKLKAIA